MNGAGRHIFRLAVVMFVLDLMGIASCERRDIYEEGVTPVPVVVSMDWRNLGSDPSGASIYFYTEDGSSCYAFRTNSVGKATVQVPTGYYTVITFNRTVDEYGTMHFRDMENLASARCILDFKSTWAGTADSVGRTVYEPEAIVCGRTDHFLVREITNTTFNEHESTRATDETAITAPTADFVPDTCYSTPLRMTYTATLNIRVDSIQAVKSVRSYITGMGGGAYLATRTATDTVATFVVEDWEIKRDETDYTKGYLVGTFTCFGLPEQVEEERRAESCRLHIKVLLVDGKTIVSQTFDVGDLIKQNDSELTVDAIIGTLVLPNVPPEGGSSSGFDVNIEDWGDPEDVVIPL